jgi:hypothetical protein
MKMISVSESALESIKRMGEAQNARIAEWEKERAAAREQAAKLCERARPPGDYAPGTPCTITRIGDLYMDAELRVLIGQPCEIVKRTKAGLIQVAFNGRTYSVPQRNVMVNPNRQAAKNAG